MRDVIAKRGDEMAIVDRYRDIFGRTKYRAGVLKIKMVPQTWCDKIGSYDTEAEAKAAAVAALSQPNGERS